MNQLKRGLSATAAVLTVELPLNDVMRGQQPPAPLSRVQAEALGQAIAKDFERILGDIGEVGMVVAGALYDMTEILRPGLPVIETALELYRANLEGETFSGHILALGGEGERFSVQALAPLRRPGSGPLLVLPLVFVAEHDTITQLSQRLEEELLEQGRTEQATELAVRQGFGLEPENLAYATLHDLAAVLKVQLEHNDLAPLWQLLEAALYSQEQTERVELASGNIFILEGNRAYSPFYTFDQWAALRQEAGAAATESYGLWLRNQRMYTAGLGAHGLEVLRLPGDLALAGLCASKSIVSAKANAAEDADYFAEPATAAEDLAGASIIALTEQFLPHLGPVAYTVLVQAVDGQVLHLSNEYPLRPEGIMAIRQYWQRRADRMGVEYHLAQPGEMVLSDDGRQLVPFLDHDDTMH